MKERKTKGVMGPVFRRILTTGFLLILLFWAPPLHAQTWTCVDFEDLNPGDTFHPGDIIYDSGTEITIEQTICLNGLPCTSQGTAMVTSGKAGGSGNEIYLDPYNLRFHFTYPINGLNLRFCEKGKGNINIEINGDFRNTPHLVDINGLSIGGVRVTLIFDSISRKGILELDGRIESFMIGGYEVGIDDVCPVMENTAIYFSDSTETPGSVYQYYRDTNTKKALYTRPSDNISSFIFAPWNPNQLYYISSLDNKIFSVELDSGSLAENIIFKHTTFIQDIAFDSHNNLYLSDVNLTNGTGKIWRIESNGTDITLFYEVLFSEVDGFWSGTFTFAPDNTLYLSTGNYVPARIYKIDVNANTVTNVFTSSTHVIMNHMFRSEDLLYYTDTSNNIYRLDLNSLSNTVVYTDPANQMWDVGFRDAAQIPTVGGTWIMPYSIRGIRFDKLKKTGLIDYKDALSGREMSDAPFGGNLWFQLHSSDDIPTKKAHYYRYSYRRKGTAGWNEFDATISIHYVRNRYNLPPVFPKFKLGPYDVKGKKLYRFRPHKSELENLVPKGGPLDTVGWPKIPFPRDIYRANLNTVAEGLTPGEYEFLVEIFDETGKKSPPGSTFDIITPAGVDSQGAILTDLANITNGGFQFVLHIDNRKCSAEIPPLSIGAASTDTCGFLLYNPANPGFVNIEWHAWHPGGFGIFRLNLIRGTTGLKTLPATGTPYISLPLCDEVSSTDNSISGPGNFLIESPTDLLLGNCTQAAYAISLYVYAKATEGDGYRIKKYDASRLHAFALAEME